VKIVLSTYLDRFDEKKAAEDEEYKLVSRMCLGAELAFSDLLPTVGIADIADRVREIIDNPRVYYGEPILEELEKVGDNIYSFKSPIQTEFTENNKAIVRIRHSQSRRRAVLIVPHWNVDGSGYVRLARLIRALGYATAELTLPYHGCRKRSGAFIADDFLSANLGKTIRSVRQTVLECRQILTVLQGWGYSELFIIGVSLGSCIAGVVTALDTRIRGSALVLTAGDFAEVVWTGRATRHIHQAVSDHVSLEQLKSIWALISTSSYIKELSRPGCQVLVISGSRDRVVMPYLTARFVSEMLTLDVRVKWCRFPCGHYSMASVPFNVLSLSTILYWFSRS
jgi:hypothetical protein